MQTLAPQSSNTLANASLGLGISSAALVFGIGLWALVETHLDRFPSGENVLVLGASGAFLGSIGILTSVGSLASRKRSRAVAGLIMSILGVCLFLALLCVAALGAG